MESTTCVSACLQLISPRHTAHFQQMWSSLIKLTVMKVTMSNQTMKLMHVTPMHNNSKIYGDSTTTKADDKIG